ncbi:toxic anion resistance protein [Wenzhouxiangella sp. AB-CW3]|uniref:toxic anion resistance protein n=1 Tax=Wenzhouxiangella sp. AB-CW3 TaxID=2771012 RepID=UPI00168B5A2F|nr:toxic anion resistance protein [Wenzhouxiangella sp. AB-CW3]QOC21712.1 toxic anion resistance protein [Wenzhouxiangella sp. AB-CW3]
MTTTIETEPRQDEAVRREVEVFLGDASRAFDLEAARAEKQALIEQIKGDFSWEQPEQFAADQATGVSQFADTIVEGVRSANLGSVHDHLTELRMVSKRLSGQLEPSGFLSRFFFNARKALERFAADWSTVDGQINQVIATLERDKRGSLITIENLREIGQEAIDNFRHMAAAIVAGQEILAEERERLAGLKKEVDAADDPVQAAELRQLEQRADVFDRRLTNLEKSRAIAAGMIPTIQQTLHSEIIVSEELDMALSQAIPLMKQQLAVVVEQVRQQERLESLAATRNATEEMMEEIADRLETNQDMVDKQVREGIASADKVVEFLHRIGDTIEEIDQRQAEAQRDRAAARDQLQQAVSDLRDRLS